MFEDVEAKNNRIKAKQNLYYNQIIPRREQNSCFDEKDHLATAL